MFFRIEKPRRRVLIGDDGGNVMPTAMGDAGGLEPTGDLAPSVLNMLVADEDRLRVSARTSSRDTFA